VAQKLISVIETINYIYIYIHRIGVFYSLYVSVGENYHGQSHKQADNRICGYPTMNRPSLSNVASIGIFTVKVLSHL
jgi:hypothetical protein